MQACLFAADYAILAAGEEDRARIPKVEVVLSGSGLPKEAKMLFRAGWDERRGAWGTAGLMAGSSNGFGGDGGGGRIGVEEVVDLCCGR